MTLYGGSRSDHSFIHQISRVAIHASVGEVETGRDERSRLSMLDIGVEKGILVSTRRMVSSHWV